MAQTYYLLIITYYLLQKVGRKVEIQTYLLWDDQIQNWSGGFGKDLYPLKFNKLDPLFNGRCPVDNLNDGLNHNQLKQPSNKNVRVDLKSKMV